MPNEEDILLGRIALAGGLITRKQLDECLSQLDERESDSLVAILLRNNYLTRNQVESILEIQGRDPGREMPTTPEDTRQMYENSSMPLFGKVVLKQNLATKRQVKECLKIQRELEMEGKVYRLGELMVKKGYLDREEVQKILRTQYKKILRCSACGAGFNYPLQVSDEEASCPKCNGKLEEGEPGEITALGTVYDDLDQDPQTLIGRELGGCVLEERIGRGSMASIYRGTHLQLEKSMAVKILHEKALSDHYTPEEFMDEARMAANLEHENIVRVYNAGIEEGVSFIQMELMEGTSLNQILDNRNPLKEEEAIDILEQTARGLSHAHQHDVIHRDMKPGNLMVTDDGTIKITDFGLARYQKELESIGEDEPVSGTPYYMSPEQWKRNPLDPRSDIYSLGVTFYRILTGEHPFQSTNLRKLMHEHMEEPPDPPKQRNPELSHEMSSVIEKMIEKQREDRYESVADILRDLDRIRDGLEPKSMLSTGQTTECEFCQTINRITRERCRICNEPLSHESADLQLEESVECPNCERTIDPLEGDECPRCGTAVEWS